MNYQAIIDFWLRLYRDFLFFAISFKLQITEYAKTILISVLFSIRNLCENYWTYGTLMG